MSSKQEETLQDTSVSLSSEQIDNCTVQEERSEQPKSEG